MSLNLIDPFEAYVAAGTSFTRLSPQGNSTQLVYATFDEGQQTLLPFVDTGLIYPGVAGQMGDPSLLRYFYAVRFGGFGKLYIRAMVENTEVQRGYVEMVEDATQASVFKLPKGTAGFGIRLQIVGLAWWRYFEIDWDPVVQEAQA